MNDNENTPSFAEQFPALHDFILMLVADHHAGHIKNWDDLDERVFAFFTVERMEQMEAMLPHWQKMTSYREGVTLTHVMCVFLGLYLLPEYASLTPARQNLMQWIVLLHDVEKEAERGQRDPFHAFRSAATAAKRLPHFGFETTGDYVSSIESWSDLVLSACIQPDDAPEPIQDNLQFPKILEGIDGLFGKGSAGAAVVKTVLLHMSISVVQGWPQAAPLTVEEITRYVDRDLLTSLKVMMLSDNEGWSMFYPDRDIQRFDTLEVFEELEKQIP